MYDCFIPSKRQSEYYVHNNVYILRKKKRISALWVTDLRNAARDSLKASEKDFLAMIKTLADCICSGGGFYTYPKDAPLAALIDGVAKTYLGEDASEANHLQASYDYLRYFMQVMGITEPFWKDPVRIPVVRVSDGYVVEFGSVSKFFTPDELRQFSETLDKLAFFGNRVNFAQFSGFTFRWDYPIVVEYEGYKMALLNRQAHAVCEHIRLLLESESTWTQNHPL